MPDTSSQSPLAKKLAVMVAAQAQGMQAAFVPRPLEHGPHHVPGLTPDPTFEVVATDFMDLAR